MLTPGQSGRFRTNKTTYTATIWSESLPSPLPGRFWQAARTYIARNKARIQAGMPESLRDSRYYILKQGLTLMVRELVGGNPFTIDVSCTSHDSPGAIGPVLSPGPTSQNHRIAYELQHS